MPWQQYVADVALEIDPSTGLLAYQEIGLTVPRQSGKTTLLLALMVHRALALGQPFGRRQNILYTAQTRLDARKKWEDEHLPILEAAKAFRGMYRVRLNNGHEAILWKNGSKQGLTSSTEKAGHGETLDLGLLDEAFSQVDDRVEQAMKPAMVTRPNAQFMWDSTAGTANSLYLLSKVETGRALVGLGIDVGTCYFEWRGDPNADPADPVTWYDCMPALGITAREESVANFQRTMKPSEFRRAFLNIADTESSDEWAVISSDQWSALSVPSSKPVDPVVFAADITPDRSFGAIAVAGRTATGQMHVEIVEHKRGTGWMVGRIVELAEKWNPCAIVVDAAGPAGSLLSGLGARGVEVLKPNARDATQAAAQFYDAATDARDLRHIDQPALTAAVAGAQRRRLGDAWAWDRRGVSVDISPLVAASLAAWGHNVKAHDFERYDALANVW
jgi:phage terminase large subunit-like protein